LVEIVRRIIVVKKLYGVVAFAAGAFVLGPVYAQSPLDDWNACVDTWGEEACGPAPSEDPPSDPTTPTDPTPPLPDPTPPLPDPTPPLPDPTPPLPDPTPPLPEPTPPTTQPPASPPPVVGTPGGPSGHGKRHAFGHWRNHGHQYAYGHAKACPKVTNFGRSVQAAVAALVKKAKSR
jgi:hypothetical protein